MKQTSQFWDALAPYHSTLENNYFDLPSLRRILPDLHEPVLVVGAGQGLIVAELQKKGLRCDGVDFSPEMIRYARMRRGLSLIQADAKAMPLKNGTYRTIICATGVVDFTGDEAEIKLILDEARRIVIPPGNIFVAFYRVSAALEDFLTRLGLLHNNMLLHRETLEMNRLTPLQMLSWVAKKAGVGYPRAAFLLIRMSAFSTVQEKTSAFKMLKVFRKMNDARALIDCAAVKQPYRNKAEIRNLFGRLGVPMKQLRTLSSCFIAQI
jgi:ubiquinone/menaquinone biosynthesis C-methylase UbiE